MASWDDVRALSLDLPEVAEGTMYGSPAWRVRGTAFAWERPLRRRDFDELGDAAPDGPVLAVKVEHLGAKEALLATEPATCFTTSHFDGHAIVLVRLARIATEVLRELLGEAWLCAAPAPLARAHLAATRPRRSAPDG